MMNGKADSTILGYLGRALSFELSAVQLYSTQARLVEIWGFSDIAGKLSEKANVEFSHSNTIIGRMLALGVAPNASQLRPVHLGDNVLELLQRNYTFSQELISLYSNAVNHSKAILDHDNRVFFESLLAEEKNDAQALYLWLQKFQETGKESDAAY